MVKFFVVFVLPSISVNVSATKCRAGKLVDNKIPWSEDSAL